jgi:hypothetical protein
MYEIGEENEEEKRIRIKRTYIADIFAGTARQNIGENVDR